MNFKNIGLRFLIIINCDWKMVLRIKLELLGVSCELMIFYKKR